MWIGFNSAYTCGKILEKFQLGGEARTTLCVHLIIGNRDRYFVSNLIKKKYFRHQIINVTQLNDILMNINFIKFVLKVYMINLILFIDCYIIIFWITSNNHY
jgi:hypothetical protein